MKPHPTKSALMVRMVQIFLYLPTFAYFNVTLGAAVEFRSSDLSVEAVLSEEGHQVGTCRSLFETEETNSTELHFEFVTTRIRWP